MTMALDFPTSPTVGTKYPQPAVAGVPVYMWDGEKWTTLGGTIDSGGASSSIPLMNGTAAAGTSNLYSRGDHIHPKDTSIVVPVAATMAEYIANSAPTKMLTPGAVWSAAPVYLLTDGATATPDMNLGIDFQWSMVGAAARTLVNPTNTKPGQKGLIYLAAAAPPTAITFGSKWKFAGGIKPATILGIDILSYAVGGGTMDIFCSIAQDYK
jgi:hypothetical protein